MSPEPHTTRAAARAHFGLRIAHVALTVWAPLQLLLLITLLLSVELEAPAAVLGLYAGVTLSWVALAAWAVGLGTCAAAAIRPAARVAAAGGALGAVVYVITSVLAWEPLSLAVTLASVPGVALLADPGRMPEAVRRSARHTLGALVGLGALGVATRALDASSLPGLAAAARGLLGVGAVLGWLLLLRTVRGVRVAFGLGAGVRERFDARGPR
ncbi:MAG: hypothetical protein ACQEXJ_19015 [Myxococcota bacterium]